MPSQALKTRLASGIPLSLVLLAVIMSVGCGLDRKGMVLFTDPAYRATVIGTEKDGFTVPDGILWRQGRLYIADEGGSSFEIWSGPGHSVKLCDRGNGIGSPEDMAVDSQGNIYFTDDDNGGVWKINNLGQVSRLVGPESGLLSTEGIVLAPDGDLLVGEDETHTVYKVTPEGKTSVFLPREAGIGKAETMTFDESGDLFIGDNESDILYLRAADGVLHRLIENVEGFSPETICYAKGVLYITDSKDGKLFTYSPKDGLKTIAVFAGKLHPVNGVTTDDDGNIYVSIQTDLKKKIGYLIRIDKKP